MRERLTRQGILAALGPGLVWAAAAVGVSHLLQSTRAGASYGFALVGVVAPRSRRVREGCSAPAAPPPAPGRTGAPVSTEPVPTG